MTWISSDFEIERLLHFALDFPSWTVLFLDDFLFASLSVPDFYPNSTRLVDYLTFRWLVFPVKRAS